jgi:hypothetical protein
MSCLRSQRVAALCAVALGVAFIPTAVALAKTSTTLSSSLNRTTVTYASPATLSGVLKTSSGRKLSAQTVYLYRGSTRTSSKRTGSNGRVSFLIKHYEKVSWRLKYSGSAKYGSATSPARTTTPNLVFDGMLSERDALNGRVSASKFAWLGRGRQYQYILAGIRPEFVAVQWYPEGDYGRDLFDDNALASFDFGRPGRWSKTFSVPRTYGGVFVPGVVKFHFYFQFRSQEDNARLVLW